jgi:signal transduction histidine kinase
MVRTRTSLLAQRLRRQFSVVSWLDRLTSLKRRLSIIILASIGSSIVVVTVGRGFGIGWLPAAGLGAGVALLLVRSLARGTTSRIRDLAAATDAIAAGNHEHRLVVRGRDEVSHLAAAFNEMAEQLGEIDRMRRSLIADASHELRTPIAAARAVLENMVDGVEPATPARLRPVLAQVERLGRLVDQLLDLSRLESGAVPLQTGRVDLADVVDDVVSAALMADPVRGAKLRVHTNLAVICGDADRLRQVVANLVDNALRHSPDGSGVDVCVSREGTNAIVSVTNGGPGIAAHDRERVFERFARGDQARSTSDGGAGLGLAIVKWIVDLHHGAIRVETPHPNAPPDRVGCRMVVTLPVSNDGGPRLR